jgi:hypothetical protein
MIVPLSKSGFFVRDAWCRTGSKAIDYGDGLMPSPSSRLFSFLSTNSDLQARLPARCPGGCSSSPVEIVVDVQ